MFKRGADICDIPSVTLSRPWGSFGLTRVISDFPKWRVKNGICPSILDLSQLPALRSSEAMAIMELLHPSRPKNILGIKAKGKLHGQLCAYQCNRLTPVEKTDGDLLAHIEGHALQNTAVIFDCTRGTDLLGPLRHMINGISDDELSLSPWFKGLLTLSNAGIRSVTVFLRPDQRGLVTSIRARAPRGLGLSFEIGQGSPISLAHKLYRSGLGWSRDVLYYDAWTVLPKGLAHLIRKHRKSYFAMTQVQGFGVNNPAIFALSESIMDEPGLSSLPWTKASEILFQTGQYQKVDCGVSYDLAGMHGVAKYMLQEVRHEVPPKQSKTVHLRGTNWIAVGCRIDGNCVIENSVILPGVDVHKGAWLSHQIVGTDWSVDYRFADKKPLNLRPADRTSAKFSTPAAAIA
ncbi:MAG: hypothetical protein ACWA40_03110 [Planktomarina sp.]